MNEPPDTPDRDDADPSPFPPPAGEPGEVERERPPPPRDPASPPPVTEPAQPEPEPPVEAPGSEPTPPEAPATSPARPGGDGVMLALLERWDRLRNWVLERTVRQRAWLAEKWEDERFRRRTLWTGGVAGGLLAVGLVTSMVLYLNCGTRGCPDVELLRQFEPDEASVLYDRAGEPFAELFMVRRTVVSIDSLPDFIPAAFVAVEDDAFYEHGGVDWPRMVGAIMRTAGAVVTDGRPEGGSTITMQLAGSIVPERIDRSDRTPWRKIGEIRVAGMIEDAFDKKEILELYMNQIYFGAGAYGIEAAAQEYFGRPAAELTVDEAALLAGLPQAPSRLNPRRNPEAARDRRNLVLRRMAAHGVLSEDEVATWAERPVLTYDAVEREEEERRGDYFVEEVRKLLSAELGDELYTGGLKIYTTLDTELQARLEAELEAQLRRIEDGRFGRFAYRIAPRTDEDSPEEGGEGDDAAEADSTAADSASAPLQGAGVFLDPNTGDVLAMVGGRDFERSKFNRATQAARQPGSAFKPFVYATALERGYPVTLALEDAPITVDQGGGDAWTPQNYGGGYGGWMTMRDALRQSRNLATVRLAQMVGIAQVVATARTLGIDRDIPAYPAVALGSAEVTPLEMAVAYGAFATLGEVAAPRYVTRVEDKLGRVVYPGSSSKRRAIRPAVAFLLTSMLEDVVNRGTGTAVRAAGVRGGVAGKTGTTNEGADTWFVGYTPAITGAIWIGLDEPGSIVHDATGGRLSAPVWGRVIAGTEYAGQRGWSPPLGVDSRQVDALGNMVGEGCPNYGTIRTEWFLSASMDAADCRIPFGYGTVNDSSWTAGGWAPVGADGQWLGEYGDGMPGVPLDDQGNELPSCLDEEGRRRPCRVPDPEPPVVPPPPPPPTDNEGGRPRG
jgi:penicillin-binding protein 1A